MIPTTIVDVVNGIRDGSIGVIDVVKIGDVTVSALTGLRGGKTKTITERGVQAGFVVGEGVRKDPQVLTMDIILANPDFSLEAGIEAALTGSFAGFTETWRDKQQALDALFEADEIVTAITHENIYPYFMPIEIDPLFDPDENWDCYIATVVLRQWDERGTTSAADVDNAITAASVNVGAL